MAIPFISILKTSPQLAGTLLAISINNSKFVGSSSENNEKLAKSDFTKPVHRVEKLSFLILNTRHIFTQLRKAFTKALIF